MKIRELFEAKAKIVGEDKDKNVMSVSVPFIQSDVKNQNGRIYKKSLLQREVERVQGSVTRGSFIGTGDHPSSGIENIATASHIVTKLEMDASGKGTAELRILPTERGKSIQTLIRNDAQLGVSIRGFGDVGKDGMVSDNYKLVGLDVVMNPSFKDAVFDKSNIFESQDFEEEANEALEKEINALEKESYLSACESGYKGTQEEWEAQYSGTLREALGLPEKEGRGIPVEKLSEGQISARTHSYFVEACSSGYQGSFAEWKEKYPRLVEMAGEVKIAEEKKEIKEPFVAKMSLSEAHASGFVGTISEFKERHPEIELILPATPPQKIAAEKILTEKELMQEAGRIFVGLKKDNPNSSLVLEDVIKMLEKEEIAKSDKRLRKQAIAIVARDLDGTSSQEQIEKMVEIEIERLTEERKLRRERNWRSYKKLLD